MFPSFLNGLIEKSLQHNYFIREIIMAQTAEAAKTDTLSNTPAASSPNPKPAVAGQPSNAPVASSTKLKPAMAVSPLNTFSVGGSRMAPLEAYKRIYLLKNFPEFVLE